jgi:DNA transformation protein
MSSGTIYQNEFVDYVRDLLGPFGPISVRFMFGGYSLYKDGLVFGLIADQELYFKADEEAVKFFKEAGSEQFTYESRGKKIKMSYWKVTSEVIDNQEIMKRWFDLAYNSSLRAKRKIKKRSYTSSTSRQFTR